MATIRKRETKDGISYHVQIRKRGAKPETASFDTITAAKKWAKQREADIERGRHFPDHEAKKHTVSEAIDKYALEVIQNKSPSEQVKRIAQLEWWKKQIGHMTLSECTAPRIDEQKARLLAQGTGAERAKGKPSGPGNTNRYMAAISHVFTKAVKAWHWMETNPCLKVENCQEPSGRVRFLNDDERKALLTACKAHGDRHLYPAVILALHTGCRKSEILNLIWDDVDFDLGQITLHKTKNKHRRSVPLSGVALVAMKEHARLRVLHSPWVFPAHQKPSVPADIDRAFAEARATAKIENFHFHDLRHTTASYLAMSGATLPEIAAVLGHRTMQMVQRYAHIGEQHTASVVNRMAEKYLADVDATHG